MALNHTKIIDINHIPLKQLAKMINSLVDLEKYVLLKRIMTLGDSGGHERCPVLSSGECELSVGPRRRLGTGRTASGRRRRSRPPGRLASSPPAGQTRTVRPHSEPAPEPGWIREPGRPTSLVPSRHRPTTAPPLPGSFTAEPNCRTRHKRVSEGVSFSRAPQQHTPTFWASWTIFRFPGPRHSSV